MKYVLISYISEMIQNYEKSKYDSIISRG